MRCDGWMRFRNLARRFVRREKCIIADSITAHSAMSNSVTTCIHEKDWHFSGMRTRSSMEHASFVLRNEAIFLYNVSDELLCFHAVLALAIYLDAAHLITLPYYLE